MTSQEVDLSNASPSWLAREYYAKPFERPQIVNERLKTFTVKEQEEYIAATRALDILSDRELRIAVEKDMDKKYPLTQAVYGDTISVSEGDSLYSRNLRGIADGFSSSIPSFSSSPLPPKILKKKSKRLVLCIVCRKKIGQEFFSLNQWTKSSPTCKACLK